MTKDFTLQMTPIGFLRGSKKFKTEAGRQPQVDKGSTSIIDLCIPNAALSTKELSTFSHIWVLFVFHQNSSWKPLTKPPRLNRKVGVLATRSPFRPNPIGMSCVELLKIEGSQIKIGHHDILDGSPIIDIKPYIEYADVITHSQLGWIAECDQNTFEVHWSDFSIQQIILLKTLGLTEIENVATNQLSFNPMDKKRKRIRSTSIKNEFILSYRTWRIHYQIEESIVTILKIFSGYSSSEMENKDPDPYNDKQIHRLFIERFPSY